MDTTKKHQMADTARGSAKYSIMFEKIEKVKGELYGSVMREEVSSALQPLSDLSLSCPLLEEQQSSSKFLA